MRFVVILFLSGSCMFTLFGLTPPPEPSAGVVQAVEYFRAWAEEFADANSELEDAVKLIRNDHPQTILAARDALKRSRICYKHIEFFIEYFFKTSAFIYNSPPKYEIEEPYMEYQAPIGMQVIEGLLFDKDVESKKTELLGEAGAIASSSRDLNALLYNFTANDSQVLESLRLELIRIYSLGLSGFDAPCLKTGVRESYEAFSAIKHILIPYTSLVPELSDSLSFYAESSLAFLKGHTDFDSFDRADFYTLYGLPFQQCLGLLIKRSSLEINTSGGVLNYDAANIFSADALNINAFPALEHMDDAGRIKLGRKLFSETMLSGNNKVSCATCHQPGKYFTDGLTTSMAIDGHSNVQRNAPSLLYSCYQFEQFWDGRAKSIDEQVREVIASPLEMNGDYKKCITSLTGNAEYRDLFNKAFPDQGDSLVTVNKITGAIASYIRTLNPRNAAFDRYIQGDRAALTAAQKHGFNLFMGKAQCGTCHFAPLFNGLVPPFYNISELEVAGTPANDNFRLPVMDSDSGRFKVFPIEFYLRAFKTPTVRNVSRTGPYMHNGAFKSLEKVVEFYNIGGGKGMRLNVINQTLATDSLKLSGSEINDLVCFMHSLEDTLPAGTPNN